MTHIQSSVFLVSYVIPRVLKVTIRPIPYVTLKNFKTSKKIFKKLYFNWFSYIKTVSLNLRSRVSLENNSLSFWKGCLKNFKKIFLQQKLFERCRRNDPYRLSTGQPTRPQLSQLIRIFFDSNQPIVRARAFDKTRTHFWLAVSYGW